VFTQVVMGLVGVLRRKEINMAVYFDD